MSDVILVYKKTDGGINGEPPIGRLLGISPKLSGTDLIILQDDGQVVYRDIRAVLAKVEEKEEEE